MNNLLSYLWVSWGKNKCFWKRFTCNVLVYCLSLKYAYLLWSDFDISVIPFLLEKNCINNKLTENWSKSIRKVTKILLMLPYYESIWNQTCGKMHIFLVQQMLCCLSLNDKCSWVEHNFCHICMNNCLWHSSYNLWERQWDLKTIHFC